MVLCCGVGSPFFCPRVNDLLPLLAFAPSLLYLPVASFKNPHEAMLLPHPKIHTNEAAVKGGRVRGGGVTFPVDNGDN